MDPRKNYSAESLALDESFQKWVLRRDAGHAKVWESWIKANPDKTALIEEATELVKNAGISADPDANRVYLEGWEQIRLAARNESGHAMQRKYIRYATWIVVAMALIVTVIYWILYVRP